MIFLEFHVKGDGRAFIEVGQIVGVIAGEGCDIHTPGTATKPVRVLLRHGETIDIIGEFAGKVLARIYTTKKLYRDKEMDFLVDYLEPLELPDE